MANMEMKIDSIRASQLNNRDDRVVTLREKGKDRYLVIWIGPAEGDAIAMKMQGLSPARPQTHDFACGAIDALGGSIESVVIDKLEDDCLHAKVIIRTKEGEKMVDCRPSDAMAMALRAAVPILTDEEVLNKAGIVLEPSLEPSEALPEGMSDDQQSSKEER